MTVLNKKFGQSQYEVTYMVDEVHHGMRLDQFMKIYLPSFSRQQIKEKIKLNEVKIIGRPGTHKPKTTVHWQEQIFMTIPKTEHEDEWWNGKKLEFETTPGVIYEDDDLIVASKPAYMATHPTGKHLFNCATVFFENKYDKTIHSVHRLDRETSGVLLLGKNPKTAQQLTTQFEEDNVRKCYFFIAIKNDNYDGRDSFTANQRLGQKSKTGLERVYIDHYPQDSKEGKRATTHFQIVHEEDKYVLGLAYPQTGRQHQIRVHAMIHGLPLLGDKLYLGSFEMFQRFKDVIASDEDHELMQIPRHALHATAINIPYKNKRHTFHSPIPTDLKEWMTKNLSVDENKLNQQIKERIEAYYEQSTTSL